MLASTRREEIQFTAYFTDINRYKAGEEPFEVGVARFTSQDKNLPGQTLEAFFTGPSGEERARGLEEITSGFTGFRELIIIDRLAHLYLEGQCASNGATYTVAQPIFKNLLQYHGIRYVKIYDAEGKTEDLEGQSKSIPFCLEP